MNAVDPTEDQKQPQLVCTMSSLCESIMAHLECLAGYRSINNGIEPSPAQVPAVAQELANTDLDHSAKEWISYFLSGKPKPVGNASEALSILYQMPKYVSIVSFIGTLLLRSS